MHLIHALAWCMDCKWKVESRNAMGVAAIDHQKTGHCTMVELGFNQVFGERKSHDIPEVKSQKEINEFL